MGTLSSYSHVTTLTGTERVPVVVTPGVAGGNAYITADEQAAATPFSSRYSTFVNGTYTPTLVGMVIGTGGTPTNTANYTFVGTSAGGVLTVEGKIKFGTSGQTFPAATITASLPAGYSLIDTSTEAQIAGSVSFLDVGTQNYKGFVLPSTATVVRFMVLTVSGTFIVPGATGTTTPFTWTSNDEIYYRYSARVTTP